MSIEIIIIPIYKEYPTNTEIASFTQCLKILFKYPISIVCPNNLDLFNYQLIAKSLKKDILVDRFDDIYFKNIEGYNKLLLSSSFYKRFIKYEYLLIHQLDAWVFRDELKLWVDKGYDYIGAPWFEDWHEPSRKSKFVGVGNGGFSLRKTRSFIRLLKYIQVYNILNNFFYLDKIINFFYKLNYRNEFILKVLIILSKGLNEDYYINKVSKFFRWFSIASIQEASLFSFDTNPKILYTLTNNKLPFGCHAWNRYDPEFWNRFIKF